MLPGNVNVADCKAPAQCDHVAWLAATAGRKQPRARAARLLVGGGHAEGEVQEELDGGHDDRRVGVREPVVQQVHDVVHLLLIARAVDRDRLQHLTLRPLRELLRRRLTSEPQTWLASWMGVQWVRLRGRAGRHACASGGGRGGLRGKGAMRGPMKLMSVPDNLQARFLGNCSSCPSLSICPMTYLLYGQEADSIQAGMGSQPESSFIRRSNMLTADKRHVKQGGMILDKHHSNITTFPAKPSQASCRRQMEAELNLDSV